MIPTWVAVVVVAIVGGTAFTFYSLGWRQGRRVTLMGVEWIGEPRHRGRRPSRHLWRRFFRWLGFIV